MPTRIHELVKTYKLINDPNAPSWSVRFVGGIAGIALLLAGVGAIMWAAHSNDAATDSPNAFLATTQDNSDGSHTDYVGFDPARFDAAIGWDPARVDAAYADWQITHPNVQPLAKEPVWSGSHVIGYNVTYR
ncbi:MAG: hypothetical protein WDA16_01680 [Candidatus Thermoplasmatota archaeon]